jgi:micrococcal nuclease
MSSRKIVQAFLAILGLFLISVSGFKYERELRLPSETESFPSSRQEAKVLKVVDGDTIEVLIGDKKERIRLIGIDSPELSQCFGQEASKKAKEILTDKTIILESDSSQSDKDKYGRLLRYMFLSDGTNFDEFMVINGFAKEYTYRNISYKYQSEFFKAEIEAKKGNKGLWERCRDF